MSLIRDLLLMLGYFGYMGASTAPVHAEEPVASTGQYEYVDQSVGICGHGVNTQGGLVICRVEPGTRVTVAGTSLQAGDAGSVQIGLRRNAPSVVGWSYTGEHGSRDGDLSIAPRSDKTTTITGIACDKIDARTPEQKAHAARSWEKKAKGWATFHDGRGALDGFIQPAEGRISSPFGFTRSYVTEGCPSKTKPHLGYDIAAPTGAPIIAPASGIVTLAEDDLYYEGGTVFLDHGHGLTSIFLHMSSVEVNVGEELAQGDAIGKIGATGRVTGPHVHWAVKWRDLSRGDDRGGDYYIDPALLLQIGK